MTIAIFGGGPIISGKEVVSLTLGRGLRNAGLRTVWITTYWEGNGAFVRLLRSEKFEIRRLWLGFISISPRWKPIVWTLNQLRKWPALIRGYLEIMKTVAPDVVIHTNFHHALLLLPVLDRFRDIYWSHEVPPNNWRYRWAFRRISRRVARVVCVSHAAARSWEALGVDADRITVVHNGTEFDADVPLPVATGLLRVGIVGQIGPWKGHDDLVEALGQLTGKGVPVRLKIFGAGEPQYVESLKAKSRSLGIEDAIEWHGFIANRALIFSDIDVCVVPTRSEEPLSMSALEAGLAGRPLIATAVGGLPEIVKDQETGFLVECRRPDGLATAIEAFVRQPELVLRMGAAAKKHIKAHFSVARFTGDFVRLIQIVTPAIDDDLVGEQRLASPVAGYEGEKPVLDPVPTWTYRPADDG